jgi:hypothetical protein
MPQWNGIYFYGDYCTGKLWDSAGSGQGPQWQFALLYETGAKITTFGQDPGGEVYFADRGGGVFRLVLLP